MKSWAEGSLFRPLISLVVQSNFLCQWPKLLPTLQANRGKSIVARVSNLFIAVLTHLPLIVARRFGWAPPPFRSSWRMVDERSRGLLALMLTLGFTSTSVLAFCSPAEIKVGSLYSCELRSSNIFSGNAQGRCALLWGTGCQCGDGEGLGTRGEGARIYCNHCTIVLIRISRSPSNRYQAVLLDWLQEEVVTGLKTSCEQQAGLFQIANVHHNRHCKQGWLQQHSMARSELPIVTCL